MILNFIFHLLPLLNLSIFHKKINSVSIRKKILFFTFIIFYYQGISRIFENNLFLILGITLQVLIALYLFGINSRINKKQILRYYFLYLVFLYGITFIFDNELRVFFKGDTFADTLKLVLAYKEIIYDETIIRNVFDYKSSNPYKNYPIGVPFYYHLTPLYLFITSVFSYALTLTKDGYLLIFILFALFSLIFIKLFPDKNINLKIVLFITSYPYLFTIQRGNVVALIIFLLLYFFVIRILKNNQFSILDAFVLSMILNLRPTFIFLVVIVFFLQSKQTPLKNLFYIGGFGLFQFTFLTYVMSIFHKDYNFSNFFESLGFYTLNYTIYSGDPFNSTLFSLFRYVSKGWDVISGEFVAYFLYFLQLPQLTEITSLFLIFLSIYLIYLRYKNETDNISFIFQLLILSTLFGSKVGDYHLLALLVPIIYLLNNYPINSKINSTGILMLLLVIAPKPHSLQMYFANSEVINISLVINSCTLFYLLVKKRIFINN